MEIEGKWYTTAQAAHELGISHHTVRGAIRAGTLEATRLSPRLNVVRAEALETYRRDHLGRRGRRPRRKPGTEAAEQQHAGHEEG